jgi:hypothetical protein
VEVQGVTWICLDLERGALTLMAEHEVEQRVDALRTFQIFGPGERLG